MSSYALNHEQKIYIIARWACYERAVNIVRDFMADYDLDYDDKDLRKMVETSVRRFNFTNKYNRESAADAYKELWDRAREEFDRHVLDEPMFNKFGRIKAKLERHEALERIRIARAKEYSGQFPGSEEGLHVIDYKGKEMIKVYKLDSPLLREQSELEKEMAEELGQSKRIPVSELSDDDLLRALIAHGEN